LRKEAEVDLQYSTFNKQIMAQEKSLQDYMRGLVESDAQLTSVKRDLNATEFKEFEFTMAKSRVADLER